MDGFRDRTGRTAAAAALAAALVAAALAAVPAPAEAQPAAPPQDALTFVRQALAALQVTPPDGKVAVERVLKALFARDTRNVDMPRVRDAQQALGEGDPVSAAAYLMRALRPAEVPGGPVNTALLTPLRRRFARTPAAYGLLAAAALLIGAGCLLVRAR